VQRAVLESSVLALLAAFVATGIIALAGGNLLLVLPIAIVVFGGIYLLLALRNGRAGPFAETRQALAKARHHFEEICAQGGKPSSFFLADDRRDLELTFHDLSDRTPSRPLKALLLEISQACNKAWSLAGSPRVVALKMAELPPDAAEVARREKVQLQMNAARFGQELCRRANKQINRLAPT
jgi:hypothetical protein